MNNTKRQEENTDNELEFRIKFKEEYGIDYLEAQDKLKRMKERNENDWKQVLIKYNLQ